MTLRRALLLLVLWFACAGAVPGGRADTLLHVYSTPQEDIGNIAIFGPWVYENGDQTFDAAGGWSFSSSIFNADETQIVLTNSSLRTEQFLRFSGPRTSPGAPYLPLAVGDYVTFGHPLPTQPDFVFDLTDYDHAEFQIFDLATDPATGSPTRLAANFTLYDSTEFGSGVYGQIRFNSDLPLTVGKTYLHFSQGTFTAGEGDGAGSVIVMREGDPTAAVSVNYATSDGTATAGADYTAVSGTLTWPAGDSTPKTISVPILEDTLVEGNETINVTLSGDYAAAPTQAILYIVDDDLTPGSSLNYRTFTSKDGSLVPNEVAFGSSLGTPLQVLVNPANGALAFEADTNAASVYFPGNGSIVPVGDYTGTWGQADSFGFDGPSAPLPLLYQTDWQVLQADYAADGHLLRFAANFEALDAAGQVGFQGEVRYHSDYPLRSAVSLLSGAVSANKSDDGVTITVNRTRDLSAPATVRYHTEDYSAVGNTDYAPIQGKLTWAAGDGSPKTFTVPLLHDPSTGNRVFFAYLTGDGLGPITMAAVTINDDALTPAAQLPEPDGTVDATYPVFLTNSSSVVISAIAPLPDGRVLVGGNFGSVNGHTEPGILRLDAQGNVDPSFSAPFVLSNDLFVRGITLQPDGKALVTGSFALYAGGQERGVLRLNTDGSVDQTFIALADSDIVRSVALLPDGRIVFAGYFGTGAGLVRTDAGGLADPGFAPPANDPGAFEFVLAQPDGRYLVADSNDHLSRLNADGSLDASFTAGAGASFEASSADVVLQPDGKLVMLAGNGATQLARLNHDGSLDAGFAFDCTTVNAASTIRCLVLQPDGKLLVGLAVPAEDVNAAGSILRLNADGTLDANFVPVAGLPSSVAAMAREADGRLFMSTGVFVYMGEITEIVHAAFARLASYPGGVEAIVTASASVPVAIRDTRQRGEITLARTGDLSLPLTVNYTVKGSAEPGVDYKLLKGRKTIPAGQSTAVIPVRPIVNATDRGALRVKVRLKESTAYRVGAPAVAKIKLIDTAPFGTNAAGMPTGRAEDHSVSGSH